MAYYGSYFSDGDPGESYPISSYTSSYDIVPSDDSTYYSSHEFNEPKFLEYGSSSYIGAYDTLNYSTYNVSEPKLLEYSPVHYGTSYYFSSSETQYVVSYSTKSEFDDTEFEEYDPTPYGGGYDPAATYGKPLPPSDEICYPRSSPESNGLYPDNFSFKSIPSPYGGDDIDEYSGKPRKETEPTKSSEEQQLPEKPLDSNRGEQGEGYASDHGYNPWSGSGSGYGCGCGGGNGGCGGGNGTNGYYGYGNGCGYGLDGMDFCENLFGYWPCLSKNNRRSFCNQEVGSGESQENQWKGAADYLFGWPCSNTCGGDHEGGDYGVPTYNYESHSQGQYYRQGEGDDSSLLEDFKIF